MWQYIITFIVVIILAAGILLGKSQIKNNEEKYSKTFYAESIADGKLDRKEIIRLLKNLPASTDRELKMGAMCYEIAQPSPTAAAEYLCPVCGSKTLYKSSSPLFYQVDENIVACRRLAKQITGITVKLDGAQFCKKCSGAVESPELVMEVTLPGEKKVNRVVGIYPEDLTLLIEFTQGKTVHKSRNDRESMLKDKQKRLEQLLGVSSLEK